MMQVLQAPAFLREGHELRESADENLPFDEFRSKYNVWKDIIWCGANHL